MQIMLLSIFDSKFLYKQQLAIENLKFRLILNDFKTLKQSSGRLAKAVVKIAKNNKLLLTYTSLTIKKTIA